MKGGWAGLDLVLQSKFQSEWTIDRDSAIYDDFRLIFGAWD